MKLKKMLSMLLVLCIMLSLLPATAFAATEWAYVRWANGTETRYSTFREAWDAATSSGDKNTVGLLNNWDGGRFEVPEGKTLTLELNGWVLTRDRADSTDDGEVLYVGEKATLNIYGGNKENPSSGSNNSHSVYVYVANADRYDYTRRKETLYGGVINGGNSDNGGGGIHMKESAKVYLYNVTIAGNKADSSGANYGDGGGIEMNNKYGYLYMEDSRIIYNAARYDGGGVHVDAAYCRIDMVRSRIDHNVADDNGAGIYVEGDNFILKGDAKQIKNPEEAVTAYGINDWNGAYNYFPPVDTIGSSISYNCVFDAEDGGGGIYVDNEKALIEGVNVFGNIANESGIGRNGDGGGIYLDQEGVTVRSCNIFRNKADELGGGIHNRGDDNILDHDDNTIDSCTIYGNLAWDADGAGGGIYVYRYCDLNIAGPVIVRGNVSQSFTDSYYGDNLFLSSDGVDVNAYLIPSTAPGADVHVRLSTYGLDGHNTTVSRDAGTYDIQHFVYDNDPGKHIGWDRSWGGRKLLVTNGVKPDRIGAEVFNPTSSNGRTIIDGVYNGYDLIKGIVSYPSFVDENADLDSVFYYSDGFFTGDTKTYNPQLATLSMCLAAAAGYSNEYGKDDHEGGLTSDYLDKSQNFRQFVSDIGCADKDIFVNDFNTQKPGSDTIGVGIASKPIFDGKTLVIIGVRGMGYEAEWISNMTLGAEGEAAGWSSAANQIMAELKDYLARRGIDGASENTIFWVAGYSRAGATANLTAKRIVDAYDNQGTHTFAYPMEAPMGGVESAKVEGNDYNCIHNVVNQNDIVPWVGTTEMGFIRYGVDHYVPGSTEISANPSDGSDNNKMPEDNTAWDVENTVHPGYADQKTKMLAQLTAVNQDIIFDDYYQQATVNFIFGGLGLEDMITETNRHEDQIGTTEHFIEFFFEKMQEYAFKYQLNGQPVDDYYKNKPRRYFAEYEVSGKRTFQQAAASVAGLIFAKPSDETAGLMDCFAGLMNMDKTDLLRIFGNIDRDDIDDLEKEIDFIWDFLVNPKEEFISKGCRSIKEYLTDAEYTELSACFKSLLFPLLCFAGEDYDQWDQDILGSMGYNISRIIANHYPEVTHAWLRSYDDLYASDTTPVVMDSSAKTGPVPVALEITSSNGYSTTTVVPTSGQTVEINIGDTVRLIPSESWYIDKGEAFYYQFTSGKDHTTHPFSAPFCFDDMIGDYATDGVFTVSAVAAKDGVKLDPIQFNVEFRNASIISVPTAWDSANEDYSYQDIALGYRDEYQLSWINPEISGQEFRFKRWEAYDYNSGALITEDHYIDCFGWDFDPTSATTTVENHSGVSAKFVPVYDWIITGMNISFTGGSDLPSHAKWVGDPVSEAEYPVYWRYEGLGKYIAEFSVDIPEGKSLADDLNVSVDFDNYSAIVAYDDPSVSFAGQSAHFEESVYFMPDDGGEAVTGFATIQTMDLNLNEPIETLRFDLTGLETVTAPGQRNMEFVRWENGSTSPTIEASAFANGAVVNAYYRPIVNEIDVTLTTAPTGGEALPGMVSTTVTITNTWKIDNAVMTWRTADTTAGYDKDYTARITVNKANLTGTSGSYMNYPLAGAFSLAENMVVDVNDVYGTPIYIKNYIFSETADDIILDLVFSTAKQKIVAFADTSVTVSMADIHTYGISYGLPDEVYAYLENGRMVSVPVEWHRTQESVDYQNDTITQVTHWEGVYAGDVYSVEEGAMPIVTETITPIERPASPQATPGTGDYTGVLTINLTADDGAEIYYRVVDYIDGENNPLRSPWFYLSNPADGTYTLKYTEPIVLNQYIENDYYLFAYAKYPGSDYASSAVTYRYTLSKPEVTKLEAKAPTIAEDGNIACWYSTREERTGYDDAGNAIYETVPDQYYADETCTELLDYKEDVVIPAFVRTSHESSAGDSVAACIRQNEYEPVIYNGLETLGVQAIGTDGQAARVLTVLDSRIIGAATDYGYLFDSDEVSLSYEAAQYKYSCKNTSNTLYSGEDYCYVTAKIANGFLDPNMKACFYVRLENGTDYIYTDAVSCEATIKRSEATDGATDNITADEAEAAPKFTVHSLVLSGEIGVNFFMDLPAIDGVDYSTSYMEFTVSGKGGKTTADAYDPSHKSQSGEDFGFTCYVNSIQMADTITAVFHYGDGKTVEETYSIKQYLESLDAKADSFDETTIKLFHALADYGHYVQPFLSDANGWSIGTDYAEMDKYYADSYTISDVISAVADYAISRENSDADIEKITYTLALDSGTDIRVYFKPVSGYNGSFTVTVDGNTWEAVKQTNGRYLVTISGISAHKLGTTYTIVATTDAGSATVKLSALSYVQGLLSAYTDSKYQNAAASIYYYYVAAQAYKANH